MKLHSRLAWLAWLGLFLASGAYAQQTGRNITSTQCVSISTGGATSTIGIVVGGTWTGTLQPQVAVNGQPAVNKQVTPLDSSTAQSTITANNTYTVTVAGMSLFQICGATVASGTATVDLNPSTAAVKTNGGSSVPGTGGAPFLVASYGAKCDGSTDDSTAIQNAINAAQTAGSGTVVIPFGDCRTSTTLAITSSYVSLQGQFQRGSSITNTTAGNDILTLTGTNAGAGALIFNQINNLILKRSLAGTGTSSGLKLTNVNTASVNYVESQDSINDFNQPSGDANIFYYHCQALSNLGNVTNGWLITASTSSRVFDSNSTAVANSITNAFNLASGLADFWSERLTVGAGGGKILITGPVEDIHFVDPILEPGSGASGVAVSITNANGAGPFGLPSQISFVDAHINPTGSASVGMLITNSQGVQVTGGEFDCYTSGNCIQITGANSANNVITGAYFRVAGGTNTAIPIVITTNANNNVFVGNTITAFTGTPFNIAIDLLSSSINNTIVGNTINGFGTTGINFDATSTQNQVYGNVIDPTHITNRILDAAAGNTKNYRDQGQCTLAAGSCTAQTLNSGTYGAAPQCLVTWTGGGALAGSLKVASTTTTVTPSSSNGADTAVVNWVCQGN